MQQVLFQIVNGSVRWFNGEAIIDIPAREIATAAVAFTKLEERCRLNLGKANPAPVKSESKPRKGRSGPLSPVRVAEPEPIQDKPSLPAPGPGVGCGL